MLKRLVSLLLALLMMGGAALAEGLLAPAEGSLAPAELNEAEENMVDMLGMSGCAYFFDFEAPEGAKTIVLTQWELVQGEWVQSSAFTLSLEDCGMTGRLVLVTRESIPQDLYAAIWTEYGSTATENGSEPDFDPWSMDMSTDVLWDRIALATGQQTAVMMQCLNAAPEWEEGEEMPEAEPVWADCTLFASPESFASCDRVYAVTVSFIEQSESEYFDMEADDGFSFFDWGSVLDEAVETLEENLGTEE